MTYGAREFMCSAVLTALLGSARAAIAGTPARVLVLQTLVPGQRLKVGADCHHEGVQIGEGAPPAFWELCARETTPLVCVGREGLSLHSRGVEVLAAPGDGALVATGRVAQVVDGGADEGTRWAGRSGSVRWLGSLDDDDWFLSPGDDDAIATPAELQAVAQVLGELAREWETLARTTGRERFPGHLDGILTDLGAMPRAERPNARALWCAGLVNPHPALGVALEVRPAVLTARSTARRLTMMRMALEDSLDRLRRPGDGCFELF
jgi:hypothetical protein